MDGGALQRDDARATARRRRVLFACSAAPAWGNANPWAYSLHELLGESALDAALVQVVSEADVAYFDYVFGRECDNPQRLAGVHRCVVDEPVVQRQEALAALIDTFAPELLVGWGSTATRLLSLAAPKLPLIFMATRCDALERLIDAGAVRDFLGFRAGVVRGIAYPVDASDAELDAVARCDLVVLPSALAHFTYEQLYYSHAGKMYERPLAASALVSREADRFAALRRPLPQRDIDVLFVADRWDVPARNLRVATALHGALPSCNVQFVGECEHPFSASAHGVLSRPALYELLGRCKVAVFPGLADAAPAGMLEASAMGCNVVASPDCGWSELCHPDLIAPSPTAAALRERIELARAGPYTDQRDRASGDVAELIETLEVF